MIQAGFFSESAIDRLLQLMDGTMYRLQYALRERYIERRGLRRRARRLALFMPSYLHAGLAIQTFDPISMCIPPSRLGGMRGDVKEGARHVQIPAVSCKSSRVRGVGQELRRFGRKP